MTIKERLTTAIKALTSRTWDPLDDRWYVREWAGLKYTVPYSGINLDEISSLTIVAVYACINLISSDLATLPLPVFQHKRPRSKMRAFEHPIYRMLHDESNPEQTSGVWRQTMMAHVLLWGNGYSEIEFGRDGIPEALWPLPPWRVYMKRTENRELYYEVRLDSNYDMSNADIASYHGETKNLPPYAVLHIPALSINGLQGLSPVKQAMQAMGLAKAAEEFGARFFGDGTNAGGVIEHPGPLTKEAHKNLQDKLRNAYAGLGKSHRMMLLDEGMKYQKIGIPPNEAQFLETRKFQRSEIASMFRVPPHMIGDVDKSTSWGTGIEQQSIGYVQHTLRPWLVLWEQEIKRKLFRYEPDYFAEFVVDGLLRGDAKSRAQLYHNAILDGWMNRDEVRELENMNPIPDGLGEEYLVPANEQGAGEVNNESDSEANIDEIMNLLAEREKKNLIRGLDREGDKFQEWLEDFYRDFRDWIERQAEKVGINDPVSFADEYIEHSRSAIENKDADEIRDILENWEGWIPACAGMTQ